MSAPEQQEAACPQQEQLWEYFLVIGLPKVGLQTVQGDAGFLGTDQRYKPAFMDSLPKSTFDESCRFPPQLPTCCLPAGIDIILHQDLGEADLTPHTYTIVLTGGNGTQVYVSCLTFYDRVPSDLSAKHEDLLGAVALKALCLQSKRPYLHSSQQVLREIYKVAFQRGSSIPVPDLINSLLTVPCPQPGSQKLCLRLCGSRHMVCPPVPVGPPPGEVSLQPLLEVMQPDSLVGLFAAVLLEQRVLLRSQHHWLLTVAAEGVVWLMYPLKYQHVYIPALPSTLIEYLEAPTPFLMGLHSAESVDQRTLDGLVVADLDRGTLQLGKDDGLMRRCLNHPYMQRLERRVRMLMQPSITEADLVHTSPAQEDPWVAAAQAVAGAQWSPSKQALLLRIFMEFFREVLRDYQLFLCSTSQEASDRAATLARSNSRLTSGGGGGSGSTGGAAPGSRALRSALSGTGGAAGSLAAARSNSLLAGAQAQAQIVGLQALFDHHYATCRYKDFALLQQVMGGLPFLSFVGEHTSTQPDPVAWLKAGEGALLARRLAEEDLQAHPARAGPGASQVVRGRRAVHDSAAQEDGFDGTVMCIPDQPPSGLIPAAGLLHKSFPALVLSEYSERTQGGKRRKTAVNRHKRPSVGRRRAISELMGSPLDLRRKTPLPAGTNTDTSPPRLMRGTANPLDTTGTVSQLTPPLAPGLQLPSLSKISNVSNSSTNASLSEEYSTEAELIGRQIGMLVHLMQVASAAEAAEAAKAAAAVSTGSNSSSGAAPGPAAAAVSGSDGSSSQESGALASNSSQNGGGGAAAVLRRYSSSAARSHKGQLSAEVLEAATQLLCIQTGGNGWFIVCRLKELLANPPPPCTDLEREAAAAQARPHSREDPRGGTGSPVSAATAAGKAGAEVSPSSKPSSPQGKTMLGKSGKLLGSSKPIGLAGLKVNHGVDSFAASVMASVISRNSLSSKQKNANGGSSTSSPTNTGDGSKACTSAPSSTCGSLAPLGASAPVFNHSVSCRMDDRHHSKADISLDVHAPHLPACHGSTAGGAAQAASNQAVSSDTPIAVGACTKQQGTGGKLATAGQAQQAGDGVHVQRRVPAEVFEVLSAMLNSILEVAAAQDDSRVVLTVMELASCIYCQTGATTRYMLATLSGNPVVHTEWFWAFTFAFAVSSSYLNADDFVNVKEVVTKCLLQFAGYLAGVGIPGAAAWVLLMQMATEHLQIAHAGDLGTSLQLAVRQHMVQARQHYCMEPPSAAAAAGQVHSSSSSSKHDLRHKHSSKHRADVPPEVAAALQACGVSLPSQKDSSAAPSANASSSSSNIWQSERTPGAPSPRVGDTFKAAVTIPAPGTADADQAASIGGSRVSVSSGVLGSAASDTEAPVTVNRPMSPLNPAGTGTPDRGSGSAATILSSAITSMATPFGLSPQGGTSSPKAGAASARTKEGYGSYAKLLNRQATNSLGSGPYAAALAAAAAAAGGAGAAAGVQDSEAGDVAAAPVLSVQGGCLAEQGSMQWAAVHSKEVVALAAQSHVAVSAGLDGFLKVLNISGGGMRLAASMAIPSLQDPSAAAAAVESGALPVLQLWYDGQRAAVGNSRHQAVWIVDLTGAQASVELSGLGSSVSCLSPLYRNREALLSGLSHGSVVCGVGSTSSSNQLAAAYLWDLRKPRRPASSLNFTPEPSSATMLADGRGRDAMQAGSCSSSGGTPGIVCLSVHEDGALAAAGFRDGKVLTWDMRQGSTPLSESTGHTGPVKHISFLPRAASVAAGLGRTPLLLTGSEDWTACVWDAESGACRGTCVGHGGGITAMQTVHSNAATRLVTGAADGSIGLWGLDGEMVSLVQQHGSPVMLLKQGGDTLVSGAADKGCHVWALQGLLPSGGSSSSTAGLTTSAQLSRLLASNQTPADVGAMAFDPVAELLCAGHKDGIVSIWNCSSYNTQCSTIYE